MKLPRPLVNQLLALAQHDPEREVCGLVSGRDGQPRHLHPVANVAGRPERLFHMDPAAQIEAMRAMREAGEELAAIFHSHPHAPARPSTTDIAESQYPAALHLIVSLDTKGVLELRGYRIEKDEAREVVLELEMT